MTYEERRVVTDDAVPTAPASDVVETAEPAVVQSGTVVERRAAPTRTIVETDDPLGNVYAVWGEGRKINSSGVATGGVAIRYAYSKDPGAHWSTPVTVSNTSTSVFPTMDIVSPGVVDVAYYGASASGDPNLVPANTSWKLNVAQTSTGLSTPSFTTTSAASGIHTGCIQVGGNASCSDRSLLDFFQLVVDHAGKANVVFTVGDATHGTRLEFVKQS